MKSVQLVKVNSLGLLLLIGLLLLPTQGAQSEATPAKGPLRIHPQNPRYFTDGTKQPDGSLKAVYLTGSHTWNNLVDMGRNDPPERFDFEAYLKFLGSHGHNFIRLWAWDSTTLDTHGDGTLGKNFIHKIAPLPWARTGPGKALDGKPKFNLTQFAPSISIGSARASRPRVTRDLRQRNAVRGVGSVSRQPAPRD